jgi:hypothetical protein
MLVRQFEECSCRGWTWVVQNLDEFEPANAANTGSLKRIDELALLYSHADKWGNPQNGSQREEVGAFLLRYVSKPEILDLSRKRPSYFVAYAFPYLALRMTGTRLDAWEACLAALSRSGYPRASEKVPFRELEVRYLMWRAGLIEQPKGWVLLIVRQL